MARQAADASGPGEAAEPALLHLPHELARYLPPRAVPPRCSVSTSLAMLRSASSLFRRPFAWRRAVSALPSRFCSPTFIPARASGFHS